MRQSRMVDPLEIAEKAILLYQQGNADAARHHLAQASAQLADEIAQTEAKLASLKDQLRKISKWNEAAPTDQAPVAAQVAPKDLTPSMARLRKFNGILADQAMAMLRRQSVIKVAVELAMENPDRQVSTAKIAEELTRRGIDLKVDPQRIGTSIGNFVIHNPEFELVAPGLYRHIGRTLDLKVSSGETA